MDITKAGLDTLHLDAFNARVHPEKNLQAIKDSFQQFGQVEPILVRTADRTVIGGNGRLVAMRELGWRECSVVFMDVGEQEARALSIALNRTGELSAWDTDKLTSALADLEGFGLTAVGFDAADLREVLSELPDMSDFVKTEPDMSAVPEPQKAGNANWFYVEYYQEDDLFEELREMLSKQMQGKHQIEAGFFARLIKGHLGE